MPLTVIQNEGWASFIMAWNYFGWLAKEMGHSGGEGQLSRFPKHFYSLSQSIPSLDQYMISEQRKYNTQIF